MSTPPVILVLGGSARETANRLLSALPGAELHAPRAHFRQHEAGLLFDDFADHLRALYLAGRPVLALCAAGVAIRVLAPVLRDKRAEPPVVVVADDGSVAIPLLGGHRGANALAQEAAAILGGRAAITTAGDLRFGLALDEPPPGWRTRNPEAAKAVMAALLDGREVALRVEAGHAEWLTAGGARFAGQGDLEVLVTDRDEPGCERQLVLHPQVLALAVGCERGVAPSELIDLARSVLRDHDLAGEAVACVISIDLKADEPAVHALAETLGVPARFLPAAALEAEAGRLANPSPLVFAATGAHGVAEGAALAAAGPAGELVVPKTRSKRATCAIARAPAPLDPARIGRARGRLAIVGIGPGAADWRTPEASRLLDEAEHWVGYRGYLDLLGAPRRPGIQCHAFALGEEVSRARAALDLAAEGSRVALISSGDAGIYAMAALVVELLEREEPADWRRVALTVSPGISALQAAAARAGAPLGHDFCAISLSDLLTPWTEIERRLQAAAEGDFVTVLFNPASARRREGLRRALDILATARPPGTPVVLARNLGRPGEAVAIDALGSFDPSEVDMLSLIVVGSSRTRTVPRAHGGPLVYTPRGYEVQDP
jgi:cobalt-precorrin 5A hydrolase / precorrin-3B C17-methyltransferase